jgi:hypothetical protein
MKNDDLKFEISWTEIIVLFVFFLLIVVWRYI